jgi:hypothetical protein
LKAAFTLVETPNVSHACFDFEASAAPQRMQTVEEFGPNLAAFPLLFGTF